MMMNSPSTFTTIPGDVTGRAWTRCPACFKNHSPGRACRRTTGRHPARKAKRRK